MSGQVQKWTVVVGGGKKSTAPVKDSNANSKKIGGLQESTGAFSLYSSHMSTDEEEEGAKIQSVTKESTKTNKRVTPSSSAEGAAKKKLVTKKVKAQTQKYNFDEFVRELDPKTLSNLCEEARQKYPDNPQNLLKEVAGQVQLLFEDVEAEREFAFTNRTPGYPLTTLSAACQKPLLNLIHSCPPLAQEAIFRHCLDQLLSEVKAGLPSYGNRVFLQLLMQCRPSTCTECTQKIKLLLQSSLSKVPEALSLLWAGIPHPQIHLAPALEVWPELCLPLLYFTPSVPRQVLNYAVDYTCLLLGCLETQGGHALAPKLPPTTLCALLSSPLLSNRRSQTNVQEMVHQLQTTLIRSCSDKEVAAYFTAVFKRLAEDKLPQVAVSFAISCLCQSVSSVKSWSRLFPSLPASSQLLLKQLASMENLSPELPLHELSITLSQIVSRGSPEEKTLAHGLLIRHKAQFRASHKKQHLEAQAEIVDREGGWCSGCGLILIVLIIGYICALSFLLFHLARDGPSETLAIVDQYLPLRRGWVSEWMSVLWRGLSLFSDQLNQLKLKLL